MSNLFINRTLLIQLLFLPTIFFISDISVSGDIEKYSGPGDNKDGYDNKNYVTQSVSLEDRKGVKADLIKYVTMKQLGLPALEVPENNPITREKIELGRKLFFDRRLSHTDTSFMWHVSCSRARFCE